MLSWSFWKLSSQYAFVQLDFKLYICQDWVSAVLTTVCSVSRIVNEAWRHMIIVEWMNKWVSPLENLPLFFDMGDDILFCFYFTKHKTRCSSVAIPWPSFREGESLFELLKSRRTFVSEIFFNQKIKGKERSDAESRMEMLKSAVLLIQLKKEGLEACNREGAEEFYPGSGVAGVY